MTLCFFPVNSILWHQRTLSTYLADIKHKMLKVPKSPLSQREVSGELVSTVIFIWRHRNALQLMKPSSCSAAPDPHIVTAHTASAKSVLVQHVYWIKQQTEAASLFMETARSLGNVMVAPRHANVISIAPRSFGPPPPPSISPRFNLNQVRMLKTIVSVASP